MIVAFSVSPSGGPSAGSLDPEAHDDSVHEAVAAAVAVVRAVVTAVATDADAGAGVPIRNGSVHSFEVAADGLRLRRFDDPLEDESELSGGDALAAQNAMEGSRPE